MELFGQFHGGGNLRSPYFTSYPLAILPEALVLRFDTPPACGSVFNIGRVNKSAMSRSTLSLAMMPQAYFEPRSSGAS